MSPSRTSQRGLSECGLTLFRLRPCLITAGVLATTSTSAGPWLYKGVGWMKGSAEAAPEPDSVHPAGEAALLTAAFIQYHGSNTALSSRYTSGSTGQGIRSGTGSLDGKNWKCMTEEVLRSASNGNPSQQPGKPTHSSLSACVRHAMLQKNPKKTLGCKLLRGAYVCACVCVAATVPQPSKRRNAELFLLFKKE